jgi:serine/threonine protein kinase
MSLHSRYTILRKITDGGTAEIFLAKQHGAQGFEKAVVLKRIFTAFYADPQFRHMLVDEAHIAMTLNHSNIVQVLDLGEVEGRYFLALELVDGWTLDRVLKRAQAAGVPFPPALALYVTAEVGRALAYAHGKTREGKPLGIVHRDISPHNVMLSAEGEVKLTDFGIAKAQNKREKSLGNMIKGKISFMSPEQASGGAIDARSDLFSLGTMLYTMITRRLPFDAATDYETLMLVKSGDYLPPETARPGLNPELYRVIRKAMSKSADERYQKAEEMLVDVEQVMRLAFRAVGQTELQRWLSDLTAKDGVPTLTRELPPPEAPDTIVGALPGSGGGAPSGTDSGLVLDLDEAEEVVPGRPPPPPHPGPTEVMTGPPDMGADNPRPWHARAAVRWGVALLLLIFVTGALARVLVRRRHAGPTGEPATAAVTPPTPTTPTPTEPETAAPAVAAPAGPPSEPAPVAAAPAVAEAPAVAVAPAPSEAPPPEVVRPAPSPVEPRAAAPVVAEKAAEPPREVAPAPAEAPEPRPKAAPKHSEAARRAEADKAEKADKAPAPESRAHKPAAPGATAVAITFKSEPAGAHVAAGDRAYGTTPQTTKLAPGTSLELTFTKAGYVSATKRYRVPTQGPQTLRVTLKKAPGPPGKKAAASPATAASSPTRPAKGWFSR